MKKQLETSCWGIYLSISEEKIWMSTLSHDIITHLMMTITQDAIPLMVDEIMCVLYHSLYMLASTLKNMPCIWQFSFFRSMARACLYFKWVFLCSLNQTGKRKSKKILYKTLYWIGHGIYKNRMISLTVSQVLAFWAFLISFYSKKGTDYYAIWAKKKTCV